MNTTVDFAPPLKQITLKNFLSYGPQGDPIDLSNGESAPINACEPSPVQALAWAVYSVGKSSE